MRRVWRFKIGFFFFFVQTRQAIIFSTTAYMIRVHNIAGTRHKAYNDIHNIYITHAGYRNLVIDKIIMAAASSSQVICDYHYYHCYCYYYAVDFRLFTIRRFGAHNLYPVVRTSVCAPCFLACLSARVCVLYVCVCVFYPGFYHRFCSRRVQPPRCF